MSTNLKGITVTVTALCEADRQFLLSSMEGASVGGSITFPSGNKIEAPPVGHVWHVASGTVTSRLKNEQRRQEVLPGTQADD